MMKLFLVGESLPLKEDGSLRKARKANALPETLVPLDPRHGVFPNLVMKPLFAAGFSLSLQDEAMVSPFFKEMQEVVSDDSGRKFNLFENRPTQSKGGKKSGQKRTADVDQFTIDSSKLSKRISDFNEQQHLWLVFGHQTNFGLLWWLLDSKSASKANKGQINSTARVP